MKSKSNIERRVVGVGKCTLVLEHVIGVIGSVRPAVFNLRETPLCSMPDFNPMIFHHRYSVGLKSLAKPRDALNSIGLGVTG